MILEKLLAAQAALSEHNTSLAPFDVFGGGKKLSKTRTTGFGLFDPQISQEWVGEIGAYFAAWNENTARDFYTVARSDDFRELEDFFSVQVGRLRAEIELEQSEPASEQARPHTRPHGKRDFLVHGHDDGFKEAVARFVERIGLECIILHEKPNMSRTLIEKFLANTEEVDFAIALWTADDLGRAKKEQDLQPRARQNAVFETGVFVGGLPRERVCVIHEAGIEMPSDYQGICYISKEADWKRTLVREMKAAGLTLNLEKAFD
jgi:predicted nucleotide-binding protein